MTAIPTNDLSLAAGRKKAEPLSDAAMEAALAAFEAEERARLGLGGDAKTPYVERVERTFTASQRAKTTILVGGLTMAHDKLVEAALTGLGYKMEMCAVPDTDSLRFGKEFGNRGQCNPTYFTVGNLVKHLVHLRDVKGLSVEEINRDYLFLTAGACGPCRFGTYVTEYRKALRDAGFDGFRVMLFQQQGGLKQATGEAAGLEMSPPFFIGLVKALVSGDVVNLLGYRARPYEVEPGATDRAVEASKEHLATALRDGGNLAWALLQVRREFAKVKLDRTRPKPKVAIIGEFWAMTTEGDGNYKMQAFLQQEGAEVDIQIVTAWILFMIWENVRDTKLRMTLRQDDKGARKALDGKDGWKKVAMLNAAEKAVRVIFHAIADTAGLHGYHLSDMDEVAAVAKDFYNHELRGGEAHMEVGKLILNVVKSKVNMTLSVKPFGCMPSSGVSDGVQSTITELHPQAIFLPVETSGDGAVNVQSRVQMMLFKARQAAQAELTAALERWDLSEDEFRAYVARHPWLNHPWFHPPHHHGSTAADLAELVGRLTHPGRAARETLREASSGALRFARTAAGRVVSRAPAATA